MTRLKYPMRLDNPRAWRTYLGGSLLDALHDKMDGEDGHFPEEWIMSVVSARNAGREEIVEGMSHIVETGETLADYIAENPEAYLGASHVAKNGATPGVLIKLIDSSERLTVQVHPDRPKARELFDSAYGKTECWHILGGREMNGEKPCVYLGFKEGVTREKWKAFFDTQDLEGMLDCLYRYDVEVGDTILIEGGVPHAIGSGCFLMEIQEPTDYTIRTERTTPSGFPVADFMCHQGLGFEKMFDCFHYEDMTKEEVRNRWFIAPKTLVETEDVTIKELIGYDNTEIFKMNEVLVDGSFVEVPCGENFSGLYVLEGKGIISANGVALKVDKGQQFFIPAGLEKLTISGNGLRCLHCFGGKV